MRGKSWIDEYGTMAQPVIQCGGRRRLNRSLTYWFVATITMSLVTLQAMAQPHFTDVTAAAGINHIHTATGPGTPQLMAGGAAAGDYNGDGWVDLFVTRADNHTDVFYRNLGNGTFVDDTLNAIGANSLATSTNGAAFGDIENDGDLDLYLTAEDDTRNYLFINDGNGIFSEMAQARGAAIEGKDMHYGTGVAFGDYNRDGFLDIYAAEWRGNVHDDAAKFVSNSRLLRNQGLSNPGFFTDQTEAARVTMPNQFTLYGEGVYSFSPRFSDLDGDGWPDLTVVTDFRGSRLFWNTGDGLTFADGTEAAGVGLDKNGMGSAIGDYNGDGLLDWFVTSIEQFNNGNRLYRNEGGRVFSNQTDNAQVRNGGFGWGTAFFDYDNDRDEDIVMTNGWPNYISNTDQVKLFQNDAGVFTEIATDAGMTDTGQGRGLLTFDYDMDGDLDVFIVNNNGKPVLYRNDSDNDNDFLRLKLRGTVSNRDAIGAFITVTPDRNDPSNAMVREIDGGSHFLSFSESTAHFGLGPNNESVDLVSVRWPSGQIQQFEHLSPNSLYAIEEGGEPILVRLPEPSTLGLFGIGSCLILHLWRRRTA